MSIASSPTHSSVHSHTHRRRTGGPPVEPQSPECWEPRREPVTGDGRLWLMRPERCPARRLDCESSNRDSVTLSTQCCPKARPERRRFHPRERRHGAKLPQDGGARDADTTPGSLGPGRGWTPGGRPWDVGVPCVDPPGMSQQNVLRRQSPLCAPTKPTY